MSTPPSAPTEIRFCSHCGSEMETRIVSGRPRRACTVCDFVHFTDPKVGVGIMVMNEGKLLLVRRVMNPEKGKWSIPAGFLDYGEDPKETAVREVLEETNLTVEITGLVDVYYNPNAITSGGASVFILYRANLIGGTLKAGDDAEAAKFFGPTDLPELAFTSTLDVVQTIWRPKEPSTE
ncbi:MAG: NUDIX hydrolase [Candidatus Promineifilaceae bacterium]